MTTDKTLLSTSTDGKAWLLQFDEADRPVAANLLDSLVLIPHSAFIRDLRGLADSIAPGEPLALYAARELDEDVYFPDRRRKPRAVASGAVGSEGIVASIITDLAREMPHRMLNHPSITQLRRKRCHNIVLMDDACNSGMRIAKMIAGFRKNPTLRSWYSFAWVRFHVLAYAISDSARPTIRAAARLPHGHSNLRPVRFICAQRPEQWPYPFAPEDEIAIEKLCKQYGARARIPWKVVKGYRAGMSRLVFERSCPNNAPGILWFPTSKWKPLFPNRTVPLSLAHLFEQSDTPEQQATRVRALLGERFDPARQLHHVGDVSMLLLLAALRKKVRQIDRLADALGLPAYAVLRLLKEARSHGFVDDLGAVTLSGAEELRHAKNAGKVPTEPPPATDRPYFPKSLRAARRPD